LNSKPFDYEAVLKAREEEERRIREEEEELER